MKHHPHHPPHHHPPHHHPPHHHHGKVGEVVIGMPDDTLKGFLTDSEEFGWVIKKIINEGPPPKQVRNAIILKELSELVKTVSFVTGKMPEPVNGIEIESDDPENDGYTYPIQLPGDTISGVGNTDEILEWIAEGPPHDVLRDILLVVVIKWMKGVITNNNKTDSNEK